MSSETFEELGRRFDEAADLPPEERAAYVDALARESPGLARQLASLLERDVTGPLDASPLAQEVADPLVGEAFGPFRAEELLGRGGMGAVYRGRRSGEGFEQVVALKTLRAGFEAPRFVERFLREREILAQLEHPGIARLIDGGRGPREIPWVAMEFVEGELLMSWVHEHRPSLRERLRLFLELCDALEFVHANLIVHRDIKPSNVMVTRDGRAKLLDFGIAKLTAEVESEITPTVTQARIMTPEYASPEQILGQPVTTRSDVYGLGALLYELLTESQPIGFPSRTPWDMARAIVERQPPPPSQAASGELARSLRGDLDQVVLMALRKEPERRYASVSALAADVRAWQAGMPVSARVDSWAYRTAKFLRRHPLASAATAAMVVVIVLFTLGLVRERDRAREAEREANAKAEVSAKATAFLTRLFQTADPRQAGDRNMTAADLLINGLRELEDDQELDARVRADLLLTLGLALSNLDRFEEGIPPLRRSIALRIEEYGEDTLETAEAKHRLGDVLRASGNPDAAYPLLSQALEVRERLIEGDAHEIADSYNNLAVLAADLSDFERSIELQRRSIEMHSRISGPDSKQVEVPLNNLGLVLRRQGKRAEALALARRSLAIKEKNPAESETLAARLLIARLLRELGRPGEARGMFVESRDDYVRFFGSEYQTATTCLREIAQCDLLTGDFAAAEEGFYRTQQELVEHGTFDGVDGSLVHFHRGRLHAYRGHAREAEESVAAAIAVHAAATGPDHYRIAGFRAELAELLVDRGALAEARVEIAETLRVLPDRLPWLGRAAALVTLARIEIAAGNLEVARARLDEAWPILLETSGPDGLEAGWFRLRESELERALGNADRAVELRAQARATLDRWLPAEHVVRRALSAAG